MGVVFISQHARDLQSERLPGWGPFRATGVDDDVGIVGLGRVCLHGDGGVEQADGGKRDDRGRESFATGDYDRRRTEDGRSEIADGEPPIFHLSTAIFGAKRQRRRINQHENPLPQPPPISLRHLGSGRCCTLFFYRGVSAGGRGFIQWYNLQSGFSIHDWDDHTSVGS